ncbi:hypothetical protein [Frigoriglobus tundricola]|uniref:Zinc finger/thioredoxin putative domain-containing protein n=1 Tax=Frigoriglobus tundricola TaxID=2774151 RepID=A0A6M5YMS7_9BACT|nr:hypothetical protein [Frigoriglobus tundricola]QJW95255.1 hypothetical protein FTUN_2797 [Frigoriglobus tundricola]
MPIVVACPGCPTKLSVPEAAAGRPIRCPKCGAVATAPALIPAEEVPVVDAAVVSPAPKPKRVLADADESDVRPRDDGDEERPRKKTRPRYAADDEHDRPRRTRRKSGGGAAVAATIGGLVLVAVIGAGAYLLAGKKAGEADAAGSPFVKKAPVPAGWHLHTFPEDGLRAYFPAKPAVATQRPGGKAYGVGWSVSDIVLVDVRDAEIITTCYSGLGSGVETHVAVIRYRGRVPVGVRGEIRTQLTVEPNRTSTRTVKWLGNDALEQTNLLGSVQRVGYTDRLVVFASVSGGGSGRVRPEEEAGFFDNFELTR